MCEVAYARVWYVSLRLLEHLISEPTYVVLEHLVSEPYISY